MNDNEYLEMLQELIPLQNQWNAVLEKYGVENDKWTIYAKRLSSFYPVITGFQFGSND